MSTFIPPTPAANKSAEQHQEPSEQDSFNHLLYKIDRKWSPTWSLRRYQAICPLSARDGRYVCQISRAHRTHNRP